MSMDKLKRIMWQLREKNHTKIYTLKEVRTAIAYDIGCDERTMSKYIKLLKEFGLLWRMKRWHFKDVAGIL